MKGSAFILAILISSVAFSSPKRSSDNDAGNPEVVKQILPIVKSVLQGADFSAVREYIDPGAYVIDGNRYESMNELLKNKSERNSFVEGKGLVVEYLHLWMPDDGKSAYMVIETKYANGTRTCWDSVLFQLKEDEKWEIISWHKS